ncbi:MAG TPA: hypothetical protein VKN99_02460 [Polyangia bacterium]|nr:hypothetical protein [Polyangia bacterium]
MLVDAGVDRIALPERVRSLSPGERAALSARFDAMWSAAQHRIDETRSVEPFLVQKGFTQEVEDFLLARIPFSEPERTALGQGPLAADLAAIEQGSPLETNRQLAAIALLHQRKITRERFEIVRSAAHGLGLLPAEAALALTRWFVRWTPGIPLLGRWDLGGIQDTVRPLLQNPALAPYAAIAMGLDDRDLLARGLASGDADLRFACALALRDEAELAATLDAGDELKASAARDALARVRSKLLHRRLAEGTDDRKLEIIRSLTHPAEPALIQALLKAAENGGPQVQQEALSFLLQARSADIPRESRAAIALFLARPEVKPEQALDALGQAEEDQHLFAEAVTVHLERLDLEKVAALLESHQRWNFQRWIVHAKSPREHKLLDSFLAHPQVAKIAAVSALNAQAFDVVLALWDRHPAAQIAPLFAQAFRSGGDRLVPEFWSRFKERPQDRAAIMVAMEPFRSELARLRALEPRNGPFGTRDLVRFYETFAKIDELHAPELLEQVLEQAQQERGESKRDFPQLEALLDLALPHAIALAPTRPATAALIAARLASHVVNAYRAEPQDPHLGRAVAALRRHHPALAQAIDSARPIDDREARFSQILEHLDTELRLARQTDERVAETRRRQQPAPEPPAPQPPAAAAASRPPEPPPVRAGASAGAARNRAPNLAVEAIDREPMLPDQPLATLYDYVGFMKELQGGGNVLALLSGRGMDPSSWGTCMSAWSALLLARRDLAVRFAALVQATWS